MGNRLLFVGTYTDKMPHVEGKAAGIYVYAWNPDNGSIKLLHTQPGISNPSFLALHPSKPLVYAVSETDNFKGKKTGAVYAYSLHTESGRLTLLNGEESHGTGPCHLTVHKDGGMLVLVNYLSGSVASYPLNKNGSLGKAVTVIRHSGTSVNPDRQEGPHPHSANFDPSGSRIIVPDLGIDKLMLYPVNPVDASMGPLRSEVKSIPGAGPRHLAFHPSLDRSYCGNELNSTVTVLNMKEGGGVLTPVQHISALPAGVTASTVADIHLHPNGRFLYVSNRGHDSIAVFAVDRADGSLTAAGHESTHGKTPRNFLISEDGKFLLAANQDSDTVAVFGIDTQTGVLSYIRIEEIPSPVCLLIRR